MKKTLFISVMIIIVVISFFSCDTSTKISEADITVTGLSENINKYLGVGVYDLSKASWDGMYYILSTRNNVLINSDTITVRVSHEVFSIDPDGVYGISLSIYDSADSTSTSNWRHRSNKFSSGKTTVSY